MIRRTAFGALSAAALVPVFLRPAAAQSGRTAAGGAPPDQAQQAALGGMAFALATSRLAEQRAEAPTVKLFAQLEAEEQQAFARARQMAGLPVPQPAMMDAQKQQMLQQLQGLGGPQFDRMYIQGQVAGHEELLRLHQAMAQSAPTREEQMLGVVAVPAIRTHLSMLEGIQQQMRG
jgi:putative membrane protein